MKKLTFKRDTDLVILLIEKHRIIIRTCLAFVDYEKVLDVNQQMLWTVMEKRIHYI